MKRLTTLISIVAMCVAVGVMAVATPASAGVIFQQDFSAGGVPGDYLDAGAGPANTTDFSLMRADAGAGTFAISWGPIRYSLEGA